MFLRRKSNSLLPYSRGCVTAVSKMARCLANRNRRKKVVGNRRLKGEKSERKGQMEW